MLAGAGGLVKNGTGSLELSGVNVLAGDTTVNAGLLNVTGTLASANVQVNSGASLGGTGSLLGALDIANGAHLLANSGATLATGALTLHSGSILDFGLGSPATGGTALVNVNGNLTLDGTLNVSDISGFGTGIYRLFDYTGALVDNGVVLGTVPGSVLPGDLQVQTAIGSQINLLVGGATGTVQFWDGAQSVPNGVIDGGTGTWNGVNTNWTDINGVANNTWASDFAVFQGTAGDVTVVDTQAATGLQFVTNGYRLIGTGGLNLVNGSNGAFTVRVDPGVTATLNVGLSGSGQLAKLDSGTLVLNGANSYSGGTVLNGGSIIVGNNTAFGTGAVSAAAGTSLDSNTAVTLGNAFALGAP